MNQNKQKGDLLENAVLMVEHAILCNSKGLDQASFKMIPNKIHYVEGVKHEIDLEVAIDHENAYSSLYIFECKNLKKPVSKNAIIAFSEKIRALSAQKGFFVAKTFSRYAEAQAKLDKRIVLLDIEEYPIDRTILPFKFHYLNKVSEKSHIYVQPQKEMVVGKIDLDHSRCSLNGIRVKLRKYVGDWAKECADKEVNKFPSGEKPNGRYKLEGTDKRVFSSEKFFIDGNRILEVRLLVEIELDLIHPAIVSHFDIPSRGRIVSLESLPLSDGGNITTHLLGGLPNG